MPAFYSEWEKFPAQWLRNLSEKNFIAPGAVDERSIADLAPSDVRGATQAHFFAGIGVWSYALRLAGWPDELAVWTGSCPCQPFSQAGKGKGLEDDRHLWPQWFGLIKECRPQCIFGEQSSSPDAREWFDVVSAQLEGIGYTVGACITNAARVGAPHLRHRIYFVAHTEEFRRPEGWNAGPRDGLDEAWLEFERCGDARRVADAYLARFAGQPGSGRVLGTEATLSTGFKGADRAQSRGPADELADADGQRLEGERLQLRERGPLEDLLEAPGGSEARGLGDTTGLGWRQDRLHAAGDRAADRTGAAVEHRDAGAADRLGDADRARGGRDPGAVLGAEGSVEFADGHFDHQSVDAGTVDEDGALGDTISERLQEQFRQRRFLYTPRGTGAGQAPLRAGSPTGGFWTDAVWLYCRDGLYRPTESRVESLDDGPSRLVGWLRPLEVGVEGRVGKIKAYGNAINSLQAAVFIRAFMEAAPP